MSPRNGKQLTESLVIGKSSTVYEINSSQVASDKW